MSPLNFLTPTYVQMLNSLSTWLAKAEAQLPIGEAETLLLARLAPDMFPLSTQIRFACVQAQEGVFRLQGQTFPESVELLLNEGRNAAAAPGTLADARARIDETVALVNEQSSALKEVGHETKIEHALPTGMIFDFTAEQYARDWALPQFYFHVMTAYAILRAQGVDLGKADYVSHLFAYLRPGTMPLK